MFFSLPYVPGLSIKPRRILQNDDLRVALKSSSTTLALYYSVGFFFEGVLLKDFFRGLGVYTKKPSKNTNLFISIFEILRVKQTFRGGGVQTPPPLWV